MNWNKDILRENLLLNVSDNSIEVSLPDWVLLSDTYGVILEYILKQKIIGETNPLWDKISELVETISPDFKKKLIYLTDGKLSCADYHTSLLIKLAISPTKISFLLGKSRSTINSRRETLGLKILKERKTLTFIDRIISAL